MAYNNSKTIKQNKIEDAKKRIKNRAKKLLDTERYQRSCAVGRAKYDSIDDFVKACVSHAR